MKPQYLLTPYFLDQPTPGFELLVEPDWKVNQPVLPAGSAQTRMVALYRPLADLVAETVIRGELPVSVAGDCCTSLGVLAGLQRTGINPTLIWFDAHGDFNTWETTPSGFLGGMPLAMLVGRGEQTIVEGVGLKPLPEARVILSDGRDLDPGERLALESSRVTHLPNVEALLDFPLPEGPLYVHFDTDVVDPKEAPAMNYLVPGGPSAATMRLVFRHLAKSGRLVAASLSAWNPALDDDGSSQAICMSLLEELTSD